MTEKQREKLAVLLGTGVALFESNGRFVNFMASIDGDACIKHQEETDRKLIDIIIQIRSLSEELMQTHVKS